MRRKEDECNLKDKSSMRRSITTPGGKMSATLRRSMIFSTRTRTRKMTLNKEEKHNLNKNYQLGTESKQAMMPQGKLTMPRIMS